MKHKLGARIRELRNQKKLSQKEFGKLFSLAESTIGMYERDERKPDYETLEKIADYFDVTINYMFGRDDIIQITKEVPLLSPEIQLSSEELKLFEELKKYPMLIHDLASNPEIKVKEILKLYKMKKIFFEDDDVEYGDKVERSEE